MNESTGVKRVASRYPVDFDNNEHDGPSGLSELPRAKARLRSIEQSSVRRALSTDRKHDREQVGCFVAEQH